MQSHLRRAAEAEVHADAATMHQFVSRGLKRATYQIEETEVVKRAVTRERIYASRAPVAKECGVREGTRQLDQRATVLRLRAVARRGGGGGCWLSAGSAPSLPGTGRGPESQGGREMRLDHHAASTSGKVAFAKGVAQWLSANLRSGTSQFHRSSIPMILLLLSRSRCVDRRLSEHSQQPHSAIVSSQNVKTSFSELGDPL